MKKQLIAVVSDVGNDVYVITVCEHCGGKCAETRFTVHV